MSKRKCEKEEKDVRAEGACGEGEGTVKESQMERMRDE
jgi:hypothetical protein